MTTTQTIEITVDKEGKITTNVNGFTGNACLENPTVQLIEQAMGGDTTIQMKEGLNEEVILKEVE